MRAYGKNSFNRVLRHSQSMRKPLKNVGASVRARLLNLSKERNEPYDLLLTQYALERLLYRLSISKYKEQFALKGAMLLRYWLHDPHRPTRDLDLLGFGESDPQLTRGFFKEICEAQAVDGVTFDTGSLEVDRVRVRLWRAAPQMLRDDRRGSFAHRYRYRLWRRYRTWTE